MRFQRQYIWIFVPILALLLATCGGSDDGGMPGMDHNDDSSMTTPTMSEDMDMSEAPDTAVDPDLAIIYSMIPHHQGAVMMGEVALEHAEHQELKDLASEIIVAQESEIEQMQEWRSEWFGEDAPIGGMPGMEGMGMMSDADMEMMESTDMFDQMFIDMMIEHHQSAIDMAQEIQTTTERPELLLSRDLQFLCRDLKLPRLSGSAVRVEAGISPTKVLLQAWQAHATLVPQWTGKSVVL